jgi:hypothetical protein
MMTPKHARTFLGRVVFAFVGLMLAMFIFMALRTGQIRVGGTKPNYISVGDEPVQFWICVALAALVSGIAFYYAFAKERP